MSSKERDPTIEIEKAIYDKLKELCVDNRKKLKPFVNDLLLDFINQGGEDYKILQLEKEMQELKKQTDYSQKMILMMLQNVYENRQSLFPDELKDIPLSQEFKKKGNLIGKSVTEERMIIFDESLQKEIIIKVKNNALTCSQHELDYCEHIRYAITHVTFAMKLIQKGVKIPGEDLFMKKFK